MSIGTLIDKSTPLIWRGAKACGAIEQLLRDTAWKDVDVMVIDMPPGTRRYSDYPVAKAAF